MSGFADGSRVPGTTLLTIAKLLFSEHLLSTVVQPAIADLQCEVAQAGSSRIKRLRAQCRGYYAFWTLVVLAPFAFWSSPAGYLGPIALRDNVVRLAVGSTVLTLLALVRATLGLWFAVVAAAWILLAMVIHVWYQRHPSDLPAPPERQWRSPEINFSSTEVAGNTGGLIFVIGSALVALVGLPLLAWFVLPGAIAGCALAWALVAWHTRHPTQGQPENRIVWR